MEITPNEVAQLSGHKNLKSLDSYMTASEDTQKSMSLSLSKSNVEGKLAPIDSVKSTLSERSMHQGLTGLFNNDMMTGCTF